MEVSFAIILFLLVIVFILCPSRRGNLPPGPTPLPLVGNIPHLGNKPHKFLAQLANVHGPILSLKLGTLNTIVISSAELAQQVFQNHDVSLSSRTVVDSARAQDHHLKSLSWTPISPFWRAMRKLSASEIFSTKKLVSTSALRRDMIRKLVENVRQACIAGEVMDVGQVGFDASINLLSNTIFSMDLVGTDSAVGKEYKRLIRGIMDELGKPNLGDYFPIIRRLDLQKIRQRSSIYNEKLYGILERFYDERSEMRRKTQRLSSKNDVLDLFIGIVEDTGDQDIDRDIVIHFLMELFEAGTDTTSSTIEWAMAELLRKPSVLLKAKAELEKVIGRDNELQESHVMTLPYLQAIVKETLRLHPPTPLLLPRKAVTDVKISGFLVPQGSQVLVNAWAIGRDGSCWENPSDFIPERFLNCSVDVKGGDFMLIPFGAGRRICPGLQLAMRMLHLMLGSLLHGFEWRLEDELIPDNLCMDDKFGITLQRAKPLRALPSLAHY